jgi:hypothetical protein
MGEQLSTTETFGEFFDTGCATAAPTSSPERTPLRGPRTHATGPLRPIRLTRLSTQAIEAWLARLADEARYAPKTINSALATLVACLNDAARKGKLPRNPAARLQRLPGVPATRGAA